MIPAIPEGAAAAAAAPQQINGTAVVPPSPEKLSLENFIARWQPVAIVLVVEDRCCSRCGEHFTVPSPLFIEYQSIYDPTALRLRRPEDVPPPPAGLPQIIRRCSSFIPACSSCFTDISSLEISGQQPLPFPALHPIVQHRERFAPIVIKRFLALDRISTKTLIKQVGDEAEEIMRMADKQLERMMEGKAGNAGKKSSKAAAKAKPRPATLDEL